MRSELTAFVLALNPRGISSCKGDELKTNQVVVAAVCFEALCSLLWCAHLGRLWLRALAAVGGAARRDSCAIASWPGQQPARCTVLGVG